MSDALAALINRGKGEPEEVESLPADVSEDGAADEAEVMSDLSVRDEMSDAVDKADSEVIDTSTSTAVSPVEDVIGEMRLRLGGRANSTMRTAIHVARENTEDGSQSLLDDTLMSMRQSGLSHRRIAAEMGGSITEEEVAERLAGMYTRMEKITTAEYRMLQVGRLEQVINMCWDLASQGNAEHIELLIKAIERLNKMFELENETAKLQVEIVTNAQAVMLMSIITGVLQVITSDPRIVEAVPVEELQQITAEALDVAEAEIVDEDGNVKTL